MSKLERIQWEPKYTVHIEEIDLQHQELFSIANNLMDKYDAGYEECYETVKALVDYLSKHFHAEQMIMMKTNYPDIKLHIEEHNRFIEKVKDFLEGCKNNRKNLNEEMLDYLRQWIFRHTTYVDLKFGEHFKKMTQYDK